jgi:hypothetical protein
MWLNIRKISEDAMKSAFTKELTIFTITIVFNLFSPTFAQWQKYIIDNTLVKPEVVAIA